MEQAVSSSDGHMVLPRVCSRFSFLDQLIRLSLSELSMEAAHFTDHLLHGNVRIRCAK